MNRFETHFDANYTYYILPKQTNFKITRLFENLAFVIMSTRENIRLIARASSSVIDHRTTRGPLGSDAEPLHPHDFQNTK